MQTNKSEMQAVQFADCMARLKRIGLHCDVGVAAGVVMISTDSRIDASTIRKAVKQAAPAMGAIHVENRPRKGFYVFTITCLD
ncbi:hypothetical protein ACO0LM_11910 [Undibacterium sp. Di26W]|uniref:hypothetical protein n=1 Tax=Undibacterium sp. Di26W TaxID=3413035 RepID=UPI003BF3662A